MSGSIGIGHTRWATHGAPTEGNAHPHVATGVSIVHNGIIENFLTLRDELKSQGKGFDTETDTEVIAQLISQNLSKGLKPREATHEALKRLEGAFALAIMFEGEDDLIIAARRGSPLAIGVGDGEHYIGSDAFSLAPITNKVIYLEDGDWATLSRDSVQLFDMSGEEISRPVATTSVSAALVDKGNHRHFMAKEIYEQPDVIGHTLGSYVDPAKAFWFCLTFRLTWRLSLRLRLLHAGQLPMQALWLSIGLSRSPEFLSRSILLQSFGIAKQLFLKTALQS